MDGCMPVLHGELSDGKFTANFTSGVILFYPIQTKNLLKELSIDGFCHFFHRISGHKCIEVQRWHPVGHQVAALGRTPFHPYLLGLLVRAAFAQLACEFLGDIAAEHPR